MVCGPPKLNPTWPILLLSIQLLLLGCAGHHRSSSTHDQSVLQNHGTRRLWFCDWRLSTAPEAMCTGGRHMRRGCCQRPWGCCSCLTPRASVHGLGFEKIKFLIQKVIQHTINYIMCQKEETMTISDCQLVIFKEKLNSLMIKNCSCLTFAEKSFKWQNVINWHI